MQILGDGIVGRCKCWVR